MEKELEAKEKMEVSGDMEQTKAGPVFVPNVDIFESEQGLTLLADMPGVEKNGLSIDLKDDVLTIKGEVAQAEQTPKVLYQEYGIGDYFRQFTLGNVIDQNKITASLRDGVLTLELPKVEKAKPRQIEIRTA